MNSDQAQNEDERLTGLLQEWRADTPLPPRFQEAVWRRIGRVEEQRVPAWSQWLSAVTVRWRSLLQQPAGAVAYLLALLAVGAGLGYWGSERYADLTQRAWRTAYLQSVNPSTISLQK